MGRPQPDVIPEQTNSLAVVEGVLRRFFQTTAGASTIGHFCYSCSDVQAGKGQRVPCKPPGERELGIVQETRTWHPIPLGADLPHRSAAPLTERVRSGAQHYSRYSSFRGRERSLNPERLRRAVRHSQTDGASPLGLRLGIWLEAGKNPTRLSSPPCVHRQGSAQVCKSILVQFVIKKRRTRLLSTVDVITVTFTVTVTWCYAIIREWWFRVHFIHAENLSLSTKSNLMHVAPWSEDDLSQLSNSGQWFLFLKEAKWLSVLENHDNQP